MSELNKVSLKLAAVGESMARLVTDYEFRVAELRAELTILSSESEKRVHELEEENVELKKKIEALEERANLSEGGSERVVYTDGDGNVLGTQGRKEISDTD